VGETSETRSTTDASVGPSPSEGALPESIAASAASGSLESDRIGSSPSHEPDAAAGVDQSLRVLAHVDDVAVARSTAERLVVLALANADAKPFAIEGTGVIIWDELDGVRSLARIAGDLAEEFGVDAAVIEPDVVSFAAELESRGLVTHR